MSTQSKTVGSPTLSDLLSNFKQDVFASLNCCRIGRIISFNATAKTAQVQIQGMRVVPDPKTPTGFANVPYPPLYDVLVVTMQGGGAFMQFPITSDDQCLVVFSDRNIDAWFQTGSAQPPMDGRMHDFSDAICIVGLTAQNSSIPAYVANQVTMTYGSATMTMQSSKTTVFYGSAGLTLQASSASLTDGSAHIDLNSALVRIANNTTSLLTLLQNLGTVLTGLTTVSGGGLQSASITAINAWVATLAGLLTP